MLRRILKFLLCAFILNLNIVTSDLLNITDSVKIFGTNHNEYEYTPSIDPFIIISELKKERYQTKQLNNITNTNATTGAVTTVSNVVSPSRVPCSCYKGKCGCCSGPLLASFNQKACMNITYEPNEFAFNAAFSINDRVFYNNRISGKNPPPICIRVPRIRFIQVCVRFTNVYFTGANMHTCINMEASWEDFSLFNTSFDCIRIGAGGVAVVPPEDGGGSSNVDEDDDDDDDSDEDYDDTA